MKISKPLFLSIILFAAASTADAQEFGSPSFTTLSSTNTPLAFGMNVEDASRALERPLRYISGTPGNEIYLAIRDTSNNRVFRRWDTLFLQFRRGRLTGWKGDWGHDWVWKW
jgi:hypothetical protein